MAETVGSTQMVVNPETAVSPWMTEFLASGRPMVEFDDVSIGFEGHHVLTSVSFAVAHGETRILLGPAGGGKSVLMKLANGLIEPDSGEVRVFGRLLRDLTENEMFEMRAHVGMVFQESALFDSLDVEDNVAYRLEEEHVDPEEIRERVLEALRFVELEHVIEKFPSGAERWDAAAGFDSARDHLPAGSDPYDSPTGGLDPITSTTIIELVVKQRDVSHDDMPADYASATGRVLSLATHRFNVQENNCVESIPDNGIDPSTKFLVLNEGRVVFDGTTLELTHTERSVAAGLYRVEVRLTARLGPDALLMLQRLSRGGRDRRRGRRGSRRVRGRSGGLRRA